MLIKHHCYRSTIGGNMEDKIAENILNLREATNSLIVLQQAIRNDFEEISMEQIDDSLNIAVEKLKKVLSEANDIETELFSIQD